MENNIHVSSTDGIAVAWYDGKFYKSCMAIFPFVRWAIVIGFFIFGLYLYQRDTNAQQTVSVSDIQREQNIAKAAFSEYKSANDQQFQQLRREVLTRELFEAYRAADMERIARMEKSLEAIAARSY
jgi:hypothetical protein